jgi:HK97 family phage prohead protease
MNKVIKSFVAKQIDIQGHIVEAYASTKDVDRDGEIILPTAWDLQGYNGIVVDSHDYETIENAVAKVIEAKTDDTGLFVKIQYLVGQGNDKADWAWVLVQNGLASYSVGFMPVTSIPGEGDVKRVYTKVSLLEISQVCVPANPYAVQDDVKYQPLIKAFKELKEVNAMEIKGVIPFKDTGKAPEDEPWDAGAEVKEATVDDLKIMCAWYDEQNPDIKSSYKLPHHKASGGHLAVWRGVAAAAAAILGARGGVQMPDSDKEGAFNHVAEHYKSWDKEPPEFHKSYKDDDEIFKACGITAEEFDNITKSVEVKYGRVLSETNRQKIKDILDGISQLQKELSDLKNPLKELLDLSAVEENSASLEVISQKTDKVSDNVLEVLKKLKDSL